MNLNKSFFILVLGAILGGTYGPNQPDFSSKQESSGSYGGSSYTSSPQISSAASGSSYDSNRGSLNNGDASTYSGPACIQSNISWGSEGSSDSDGDGGGGCSIL